MGKVKKMLKALFDKDGAVVYKATAWFFVCNVFQKGLKMLTMPIFTRIMSEEELGQFINYQTWSSIIIIFTTLRLDYGVFNKGMSKYSDERKNYTSSMMLFTSALAALCFGIYLLFQDFFNSITELSTTITCAIFIELIIVPGLWFWSLNRRYEYKYVSVVLVTILSAVIGTIASVIAVLNSQDKVTARIMSGLVINVAFALVVYAISIKESKKVFDWKYIKFAVIFNIPLIPHYFSEYILHQSDKIMIQKMVGYKELGLYGLAHSLATTIQIVTSSMSSALLPWQYETLAKKGFKSVEKRVITSVYLVTGMILLFICVAPEALWIMASPKYLPAVKVMPPIACSIIMIFYYCLVANIEFFYNKNKFVTILSFVCALLNIGINYVGIINFGYLGAAYATYICYSIFVVAHVVYTNYITKKIEGFPILHIRDVVIVIVSSTIVIIVMTQLYDYLIVRYVILLALCLFGFLFRKQIKRIMSKKDSDTGEKAQ